MWRCCPSLSASSWPCNCSRTMTWHACMVVLLHSGW
jgi:hypothetical protein